MNVPIPDITTDSEAYRKDTEGTEGTEEDPSIREELLSLSEAGEIKYTTKYIKKASQETLEKIRRDYNRKQLDVTNEFISDNLISKFSELMESLSMIRELDEMEKELKNNKLLKRDLKNILGHITPYIPLVGLFCGGVIIGKHVISNSYGNKEDGEQKQQPQ